MKFEEKLYELRREKGLSQEQLADLLNVSRQAVSKWEGGGASPETEKLIQISDLFGVSVDYLVRENVSVREESKTVVTTSDNTAVMQELAEIKSTIGKKQGFAYDYEYKSKETLFGLPLVHIHYSRHRVAVAKGIIAIGDVALGGIAIGGLSAGVLSIGGVSLGLLFSLGGLALGGLAMGGVAVGIIALGGLAVGVYAIGGGAIGLNLAVGGYANARVAVGEAAHGEYTLTGPERNNFKYVMDFIKAHLFSY